MYRTPLSIVIFVLVAKNSPSLAAISKLRPSVEKPSLSSATTTTSPYLMKPHPRSMKNSCNPCNSCLKKKNLWCSSYFVNVHQCSSYLVNALFKCRTFVPSMKIIDNRSQRAANV